MVVQKGSAHLERCGHAHAVHFGQYVARKVSLGVEIEQATQQVVCRGVVEIVLKRVQRRSRATKRVHKFVREQSTLAVTSGQKRKAIEVSVTGRQGNVE